MIARLTKSCIVTVLSAGLSACTGGLPSSLSLSSLSTSVGTLPVADSVTADDAPTAVYAAIAQRALVCWVGPDGPLKGTHIFHAEAASPTTGGRAEIALHERDVTQGHPWGARTFRIELIPAGGDTNTVVTMQNIKLPADLADALRTDVIAWARGKDGCQAQVLRPPPKPEPVAAAPAKGKKKPKNSTTG